MVLVDFGLLWYIVMALFYLGLIYQRGCVNQALPIMGGPPTFSQRYKHLKQTVQMAAAQNFPTPSLWGGGVLANSALIKVVLSDYQGLNIPLLSVGCLVLFFPSQNCKTFFDRICFGDVCICLFGN